jgi:hypothetical protein
MGAARIRTIKPEWPQDERRGRISRDARLLELLLRTLADDAGRLRAAPALLRGALFPFDGDVTIEMVEGWIAELLHEHLMVTYLHDGEHFAILPEWSSEQKIDHPTSSRLPPPPAAARCTMTDPTVTDHAGFGEDSSKPREGSRLARGPRSTVPMLQDVDITSTAYSVREALEATQTDHRDHEVIIGEVVPAPDYVAAYVAAEAAVGVTPIPASKARLGKAAKELAAAGKDPALILAAIDRLVAGNKAPTALPYLLADLEREAAGHAGVGQVRLSPRAQQTEDFIRRAMAHRQEVAHD